ncbi:MULTISPECIES: NAD-dependent epimerase/dehydratase family protein [Stenotrophomonas]|jgi:nucleoside-diphosphate-sugar epimerase|uniref:NAD-dependent epimerase/dehydratase family protein n=1 Tax=Stenotrophomonas TaxID=40323 RepID=UPI000474B554|nr:MULTISPECIES: NAD-dependent epimerase/dehydratase family protein [Stenotrophomonas]MBD3825333.1 NAD-dependent epimerase/dehydratase family protein [Stenotrophomonas sp.]HBS61681.1 GDP-mannose 4,6 dehydratase [Stenotrophomonas sp.]
MKPIAAITGIEGFTGPYMAAELERLGYQVQGISRSPIAGREHVIADILDRDALAAALSRIQPQVVVHLAGVSHVAHRDVSAIYQANIMGTRNLLDALVELDTPLHSVVLPSSAHVYGASSSELLTEQSPMAPFNDYAISKVASEHVARLYMDRLPIMVTRPFNYTGVGQSPSFFVAKVIDHARRGSTDLRLGNLDVERDFTDVRDLVRCYGMLIEQRCRGDVVNICSGVSTSLRTVIDIVSELSGLDFAIESDSGLIRSHDVDRLAGSNARFMALTGGITFRPLRETLQWMLDA